MKPHVCLSYECKYDMNIYGTDIFRQNKTFLALFAWVHIKMDFTCRQKYVRFQYQNEIKKRCERNELLTK